MVRSTWARALLTAALLAHCAAVARTAAGETPRTCRLGAS
jgi:hypothetical protein